MLILDTPMKMEIVLKLNWTMKEKWSGLDILAQIPLEKESFAQEEIFGKQLMDVMLNHLKKVNQEPILSLMNLTSKGIQ